MNLTKIKERPDSVNILKLYPNIFPSLGSIKAYIGQVARAPMGDSAEGRRGRRTRIQDAHAPRFTAPATNKRSYDDVLPY